MLRWLQTMLIIGTLAGIPIITIALARGGVIT